MAYRIFVSHTAVDLPIATSITKALNDGFGGDITFYLAAHDILGGDDWKREIQRQLGANDAIITILSPDSVEKPWLYVEWSHFWLNDKTFYVLTVDLPTGQVFEPMLTRQVTRITERESVLKLVQALARDARISGPVPFGTTDSLLDGVRQGLQNKAENEFGHYRSPLASLPSTSQDKRRIARFFFARREWEPYERIVMAIRDDAMKTEEISEIIDSGAVPSDVALRMLENICRTIGSAERLGNVAVELISKGDPDSRVSLQLIEALAHKNEAELRRVGAHLIEHHLEGSTALRTLVALVTSNVVLRRICESLADADLVHSDIFAAVVRRFSNSRELFNLVEQLFARDLLTPDLAGVIREQLAKRGGDYPNQFEQLLKARQSV